MTEWDEAHAGRRRWAGRGGWRRHGKADRQQAEAFAVEPHPIGIADPNLCHAVLFRDRAGHLAAGRGIELRLYVQLGQAHPRRLQTIGPDHDVRVAEVDVSVHVRRALDFLDDGADLFGQLAQLGKVRAEDFDFDGAVDAGQVVDLVLHQGHKLGLELGDRSFELFAKGLEELFGRSALAGRLQAHEDVACMGFSGEKAQFSPGPADISRNVGRILQYVFDPAHDLVGLRQRSAHRHLHSRRYEGSSSMSGMNPVSMCVNSHQSGRRASIASSIAVIGNSETDLEQLPHSCRRPGYKSGPVVGIGRRPRKRAASNLDDRKAHHH